MTLREPDLDEVLAENRELLERHAERDCRTAPIANAILDIAEAEEVASG